MSEVDGFPSGLVIEDRKKTGKLNNDVDDIFGDMLWEMEDGGKISLSNDIDVDSLFGKIVYISGIGKAGPFCSKTFIEKVGSDDKGNYFIVNNHISGAKLFFSEAEAKVEFNDCKEKYIQTITEEFNAQLVAVHDIKPDISTNVIKENDIMGSITGILGIEEEEKNYDNELKSDFEVNQEVFIVRVPGERVGSVNATTNKDFKIISTKISGISINAARANSPIHLIYNFANGERIFTDGNEGDMVFGDLEKAKIKAEELRKQFVLDHSGDIPVI